jgi:hypothetical protein
MSGGRSHTLSPRVVNTCDKVFLPPVFLIGLNFKDFIEALRIMHLLLKDCDIEREDGCLRRLPLD